MDVHEIPDYGYAMSGQIILSLPGMACMRCMQFLNDSKLAVEAAKYRSAGGRPQVVWPNGLLASTAIGVIVDLTTGWTKNIDRKVYISYDGHTGH